MDLVPLEIADGYTEFGRVRIHRSRSILRIHGSILEFVLHP